MRQQPPHYPLPAPKPLLPNEPRVPDWTAEQALTERFLIPALSDLESLFLEIRARLDPELSRDQPMKLGKPYPLGQCLEISMAAQRLLQQLDPSQLDGACARGHAALAAFLHHGGRMRQVWGDLRGEYFQNAFLAGTLYIDVSNDTVVRTKPKVEILPFAEARFAPVEDYLHFARLASRYWQAHLFPNHVVPALAPWFPLIAVTPGFGVQFQSDFNYMIALTETAGFRPSEEVLDVPPMSGDVFQLVARCLRHSLFEVAADLAQGRALALERCRKYREENWPPSDEQRTVAIKAMRAANRYLAQLKVQPAA